MVNLSWGPLIVARLGHAYNCHSSLNPPATYYNAILIVKEGVSVTGGLKVHTFPGSHMGRHLLQMSVRFSGIDFDVMTSHLESMKQCRDERIRQLIEVFGMMERSNRLSIFGGDLNLRDVEVRRDNMPEDTVDL